MTTSTSVLSDAIERAADGDRQAAGRDRRVAVDRDQPSSRTASRRQMRLAARSGSMAEATHMIDEPEKTRSVTLSGARSARKIDGVFAFHQLQFVKCKAGFGKSGHDRLSDQRRSMGGESMPLAMNREVFITCAVTGSGGTQDRSPHVPRYARSRSPTRRSRRPRPAPRSRIAMCATPRPASRAATSHLYREVTERIRDVRRRRGAQPHRRHGRRHGVRPRREARCR